MKQILKLNKGVEMYFFSADPDAAFKYGFSNIQFLKVLCSLQIRFIIFGTFE